MFDAASKSTELICHALSMWKNYIETGNVVMSADDMRAAGAASKCRELTAEQIRFVARLDALVRMARHGDLANVLRVEDPPADGNSLISPERAGKRRMAGKLHDDDLMPWGKHKGVRLGDIPDSYWRWFLEQDWRDTWPDLLEYAKLVEDAEDDYEVDEDYLF